jgi:hypothetical protein
MCNLQEIPPVNGAYKATRTSNQTNKEMPYEFTASHAFGFVVSEIQAPREPYIKIASLHKVRNGKN